VDKTLDIGQNYSKGKLI